METIAQKLIAFERTLNDADVAGLLGEFEGLRDAVIAQSKEMLRLSGRIKSLENQNKKLNADIKAKDAEIIRLRHEQHAPSADSKTPPKKKDAHQSDDDGSSGEPTSSAPNERDPKDYSANPPASDKRQGGRGPKDWSSLPRVEVPYNGPEECPCGCGGTVRSFKLQERLQVIDAALTIYCAFKRKNDEPREEGTRRFFCGDSVGGRLAGRSVRSSAAMSGRRKTSPRLDRCAQSWEEEVGAITGLLSGRKRKPRFRD